MTYSFEQWLFFFYTYCLVGWLWETSYVSIKQRHFVNRGFMRGPFLPIYGSGAIVMLFVSIPFRDSIILTYISGLIGATILEYLTGEAMEALFKVRYWDYSYKKINFRGHICLSSSLFWGLATVGITRYLHKPVEQFVLGMKPEVLSNLTLLLTMYISADFALSFKAAIDLRNLIIKLEDEAKKMKKRADVAIAFAGDAIKDNIEEKIDLTKEKISDTKEALERRREIRKAFLEERLSVFQKDMLRSNPMMVSPKFKEVFESIKDELNIKDRASGKRWF